MKKKNLIALLFLVVFSSCDKDDDLPKQSLIKTEKEAAGVNCELGGVKILTGLDANENGVLDANEVSETNFVCSGSDGASGTDGANGTDGGFKGSVIEGSLYIWGDLDLEMFKKTNITSVEGSVVISGISSTDLSAFSKLTSIGGRFTITECEKLTSLSGLENLTSIGGYMNILRNNNLASLSGLESLTSIGGDMTIGINNLASLSGLENLTSIGGNISIFNNASLNDYCAISSLEFEGSFSAGGNGYNPSSFSVIESGVTCKQ